MTLKSWVWIFLLLAAVSIGSVYGTWHVLQRSPQAVIETQRISDQPTVQISKPDPILSSGWQGYDNASIKCTQDAGEYTGKGAVFPKGCTAEFYHSKKRITLPDLASFADSKGFDTAKYSWVAQYENTLYVVIRGENIVPMGAESVDFINVFDESNNTLTNIFKCDSYDCIQLAQPQEYLTAYTHRVSGDQGVNIYRDFIYKGELHSSLVAFIPKDNKGWILGANCGDSMCADGSNWITVLDQNNFVLRFDKRIGTQGEATSTIETKYVYVPMN